MNNRSWIAVFLGLACLVLFVSVMGASGNWLNNNNGENNGMNPQQVSQTVRDMNANSTPNQNVPTKIDASGLTDNITNTMTGRDGANTNTNDTPNNDADNNTMLDMSQVNMPKMNP